MHNWKLSAFYLAKLPVAEHSCIGSHCDLGLGLSEDLLTFLRT
jgi:hypothetical protein